MGTWSDTPIRTRTVPRPATLLDAAGQPSVSAIKDAARCRINDPMVEQYGPHRAIFRETILDVRLQAELEAMRAALPPAARASTDIIDRLNAAHDALYFSPGRFAQTEDERRYLKAAMDAERRRLDAMTVGVAA